MRSLSFAVTAALLLVACDSASPGADQQIVVSALLEADQPMPGVSVSRTVPLGEVYDPAAAAIRDADVRVVLLGADPDTVRYAFDVEAGRYERVSAYRSVVPGATYRLVVQTDGREVTAETTVPLQFEVADPLPDSAVYQVPQTGPQLRITTSSVPGRQAVYIASTLALLPDEFVEVRDGDGTRYRSRNLPDHFLPVPFVRLFLNCDDTPDGGLICDNDPSGADSGASPIINEASYILPGDGTAIVNLPWLAFGFYGPTEVSVIALDDAYKAFVEGTANQAGGSTLSPGEIPNVTSNVQGGIGVFGSYARVTARITVLER